MECPKCGYAKVPETARYCPECGEEIAEGYRPPVADKIIDYRELIAKSTEGFVGRQWVRDAVDGFLRAEGPRYFLLLGEPGSGKTAFTADLVRRQRYPHHFIGKGCRIGLAASRDWRDPARFAESIGYQLLRDYGGWIMNWEDWGIHVEQRVKELDGLAVGARVGRFTAMPRPADRPILTVEEEVERFGPAARMIGVYFEKLEMDVEQIVRQLLTVPLKKIATKWPEDQVVLVVDGLDEAEGYSNPERNIFRMLPNGSLPSNVRFLFSSRPGGHLTTDFREQCQVFWLSEDETGELDSRTYDDAEAYVVNLAAEEPIEEILTAKKIKTRMLAEKVAKASKGNFLYLYHYARGLRGGDEALLNLEALPEGLYGIYKDFLSKIKVKVSDLVFWDQSYKPILGALAVAREPVTLGQAASFSGVKEGTTGTILKHLEPFLDKSGSRGAVRYEVYHKSFAEYLVSKENEDRIDGREAHVRIVDYYRGKVPTWEEVDWSRVDDYGLFHLMAHLYPLSEDDKYRKELYGLICRSFMWEKQARTFSHRAFTEDAALAVDVAAAEDPPNLAEVARDCLIHATLGSWAARVPIKTLSLMARLGQTTAARGYASLIMDNGQRCDAYRLIAEALLEEGKVEEFGEVYEKGLEAANVISYEPEKTRALCALAEVIARAGDKNKATEIAGQASAAAIGIEDDESKAKALSEVASAFGKAGDQDGLNRVLAEIETIKDDWSKASALHAAARALGEVGDRDGLTGALEAGKKLEDSWYKARALSILAMSLAQLGDEVNAPKAANQALTAAEAITDKAHKTLALGDVAQALGETGDQENAAKVADRALEAAKEIEDNSHKANALSIIAQEVPSGMWDENWLEGVLTVATSIEDDRYKAEALGGVIKALRQAGNKDGLKRTLDKVKAIEGEYFRVDVQSAVAVALAQVGDKDKALEIAEEALKTAKEIEHEWNKAGLMNRVAQAFAWAGDKDGLKLALGGAETFIYDDAKAIVLNTAAETLARVGDKDALERVLEAAESLGSGVDRVGVLNAVAQAFARVGEEDKASEVVKQAIMAAMAETTDPWRKARTLVAIVHALIRAGGEYGLKSALVVAEKIEDDGHKEDALSAVAQALGEVGEEDGLERALAAAKLIKDNNHKVRTLMAVAQAFGQVGDEDGFKRALAAAEEVRYEWNKPYALIGLAQAFAQAGDKNKAGEVADKALTVANAPDDKTTNKLYALSDIAQTFALIGEGDKAVEVAGNALAVTEAPEGEPDEVRVLCKISETFTRVGNADKAAEIVGRALNVAIGIEDEGSKADALREVAYAFAEAGDVGGINRTLDAAEAIEYEHFKIEVKSAVARALALGGELEKALAVMKEINNNRYKTENLCAIAEALYQAGVKDKAAVVADLALTETKAVKSEGNRADNLRDVARTLGRIGSKSGLERALVEVETIKSGWHKMNPVIAIAQALTEAGDENGLERALEAAETIENAPDKAYRAYALIAVAQAFAQAGSKRKAAEIALEALAATDNSDALERAFVQTKIALIQTQVGEVVAGQGSLTAALIEARSVDRYSVLEVIQNGADAIAAIDNGQTLWRVYKSIMEIDGWWRA